MVIGYESTPVKQSSCYYCVFSAEQDGEKIYFEKLEGLSSPIDYATLKERAQNLKRWSISSSPQGSLFKLTKR